MDNKLLKTRKKVDIYTATDIKKNYHCIFSINQKSRFLLNNADEITSLNEVLQQNVNHNFRYKHLLIKGAICSKSINFLEDRGWKIHNDIM